MYGLLKTLIDVMKILMIVTWYGQKNKDKFTGGFHYDLSVGLKQHVSDVAIYFPFDEHATDELESDNEMGVLTFRRKTLVGKRNKIKGWLNDYKKICESFQPDIIHAHVADRAGLVATVIKARYRVPVVITEHAPIEMMYFGGKIDLQKIIYKCADANIAVSPDLKHKLTKIYPKSEFEYIANGVIDPCKIIDEDAKLYRKDGVVNCLVVCAFYAKEIKGIQFLLPAIKKIIDDGKAVHLHICGGGEFEDYYIEMAKTIGITQNVTFYGMCEKKKVYEIMSQMDFCISASLFESAGVVVEEAMLLQKPQVVTKSGGANSLVPDKYAIIVEKGSVESLYSGIICMIDNFKKYNGKEIREYGLEKFEMDKICKEYHRLYRRII